MSNIPDFDDLPKVEGMPQGCAWGVWDKLNGSGKKDIYGTLNLLTPEVVKAAYTEARDGVHVSLNWPIGAIKVPGFGRKGLVHKVMSFVDSPLNCHGYDDEVEFNTQCSSQWDSLMHFHHQGSQAGYNGVKTSVRELEQNYDDDQDSGRKIPTLNHWHSRGGMVARGVFIDFRKYADETGRSFNPFNDDKITVEDIETIAEKQGVEFKVGDVIIIRSGFTEGLTGVSGEKQAELMGSHRVCGVTGDEATAKWFWNKHFSAVAGDMIAFEHIPSIINGKEAPVSDLVLHQYFLSLFGMSIGELWDLKALSETCAKLNRYSFLLTSVPLNVPGGIGSPPNAIAIF
ncbi:hypothetical protein DOTSEDRAFT_71333 [Dothistroma septosporum NZE10]|uniref:Cyclase-like protein n=1 Tax=Dothistroma septosporum (strain NZE10 / CBS 128990) TaxID=675120 RepID=N1PQ88_DOTSN|nr:hypothetical protein DOTSEDRAFT_71333 [Dothistroma septosporum NZE10]